MSGFRHFMLILCYLLLTSCKIYVNASLGDSFPSYKSCVEKCKLDQCDKDGYSFKQTTSHEWPLLLFWRCIDNCKYNCMWNLVENFERKGWPPPQFHGKWPFVRWMGLQEPASVIFSLFNLAVHVIMFRQFRNEVRPSSPMYKVWVVYAAVCINCWIWSAVFHSRDLPLTELMDYLSAFGMVFYALYGMVMRMLVGAAAAFSVLFTLICLSFFLNHAVYLMLDQFDYHYNMTANIVVGVLGAVVSAFWCMYNWRRLPHSKHLAAVVIMGLLTTLLEVSDFPPIARTLDAHALWHLSTTPIPYFFWKAPCRATTKQQKDRLQQQLKS